MEINATPVHEEQLNPHYPSVTVETATEESENETLVNNQTAEEEETISPPHNPEQERTRPSQEDSTSQRQRQNRSWFSWKSAQKVAGWAGVGTVAAGSFFTAVSYYGYSVLWKKALLTAAAKIHTQHIVTTGVSSVLQLAKGAMAGIKTFSATSFMTGVASIPLWGWVAIVAGVVVVIGGGYLIYKNWDKIKSWTSRAWNKVTGWFGCKKPVERVVEQVISRPITENIVAPYIIQETEPERETRTLSHEISGLRIEVENFRTDMQELLERRSEVGTTIFEEQQQQLETQLAATQTRLEELETRYSAIPEEIRRSSATKAEQIQQFQNYLTQGTAHLFLFLIILVIIFVGQKIRKFLGWSKKKSEETLEKIQQQVSAMNTELQVQKVERAVAQIRQEKCVRETKKVKDKVEELTVDEQPEKTSLSLVEKELERG